MSRWTTRELCCRFCVGTRTYSQDLPKSEGAEAGGCKGWAAAMLFSFSWSSSAESCCLLWLCRPVSGTGQLLPSCPLHPAAGHSGPGLRLSRSRQNPMASSSSCTVLKVLTSHITIWIVYMCQYQMDGHCTGHSDPSQSPQQGHRLQLCTPRGSTTYFAACEIHRTLHDTHALLLGPARGQLHKMREQMMSYICRRRALSWRLAALRWQARIYASPPLRTQDVLCILPSLWRSFPPVLALALHKQGPSDFCERLASLRSTSLCLIGMCSCSSS